MSLLPRTTLHSGSEQVIDSDISVCSSFLSIGKQYMKKSPEYGFKNGVSGPELKKIFVLLIQ
jgi:hypothetical protein